MTAAGRSYGEFLAPMPEPSRRAEDGLRSGDSSVDLADLECFLRDAKPRTCESQTRSPPPRASPLRPDPVLTRTYR